MQIQPLNYKNNYYKQYDKKNIAQYSNSLAEKKYRNISFNGINLGENGKKMAKSVINDAEALIEKTRSFITSSFNKKRVPIDESNKAFDGLGKIENFTQETMITEEDVQKSNDLLHQKKMELLNLNFQIKALKSTVKVNKALVDSLPRQLAELEPIREIERHRLIKMLNPNIPKVGFENIAGYNEDKKILQTFFFKNIDLEKTGEAAHVPGTFLFFGPTGNGKTVISLAVAEETGCKLVKVECGLRISDKSRNEFMERIEEEALQAEKRFKSEGRRTILFIDELTKVVSKDSNILEEFNEFASICSEKYHCTIFGATNHMKQLGLDLDIIKPVIMAIEPPNKENVMAMFQHYLKDIKEINGKIDYNVLADKLITVGQKRGGKYSNAQIKKIVDFSAKQGKNELSQQDILDCIIEGNPERGFAPPIPAIDKDKQEIFEAAYKEFM